MFSPARRPLPLVFPRLLPLVLPLLLISGCKEQYETVTLALDSASEVDTEETITGASTTAPTTTAGTSTEGTSGGEAGSESGTSTTATSETDPGTTSPGTTEGTTTGEPAPCDTGPECTAPGDPDGTPGPTTVPYFRGRACVVKEAKPGQPLPIRLEGCLHPCLNTNAFAFRHAFRCPGNACEVTAVLWYADVVGAGCPSDVFAKFDPALCDYKTAIDINAGPLAAEGAAPVVIPYLSNAQAAEIASGADSSAEIWSRVDANFQEESRYFEVMIAADAADAPAACDDPELCDCRLVGFD